MSPRVQAALTRWAPKIPLDFRALIQATAPLDAYAALTCPALLLRGEHAPTPTRVIAEALADTLPEGRLEMVPGCGHMGPLTHASLVVPSIVSHIAQAAVAPARPRPGRTIPAAFQRGGIPAAPGNFSVNNRSALIGRSNPAERRNWPDAPAAKNRLTSLEIMKCRPRPQPRPDQSRSTPTAG